MKAKVSLDGVYKSSEDVVAREIQGDFLIIPVTSGIGDNEDGTIFTLNDTGKAIWDKLDGERSLKEVIDCLLHEFDAPRAGIEKDVLGLTEELLRRKMLVEAKKAREES